MCASVIYAPTQGFAKLSLLLFYRRLAPFTWFRAAIYVVMFVVVAYTLGIMFSLIFPCKPIASNWDVTIEGECINKTGIYIATAVINIATDLALLVLPIPVLVRLQIPRLEKVALIAMFGVGSMYVAHTHTHTPPHHHFIPHLAHTFNTVSANTKCRTGPASPASCASSSSSPC